MANIFKIAALATACSVASVATASEEGECYVPMDLWQPRDEVILLADTFGWKIQRIKIDDGCYLLVGFDAQGQRLAAKIDPQTVEVIVFYLNEAADRYMRHEGVEHAGEDDGENDHR